MASRQHRLVVVVYLIFGVYILAWGPIRNASPYKTYGDSLMYVTIVDAMRAPPRLAHDYLAQHALAIQPLAWKPALRALASIADGKRAALILQTLAALFSIFSIGWLASVWFAGRPRALWPAAFMLLAALPDHYLLRGGTPRAFLLPLLAIWLGFAYRRSFVGMLLSNLALALVYPPGFLLAASCSAIALWLERRKTNGWRNLAIFVGVAFLLAGIVEFGQRSVAARYGGVIRLSGDLTGTGFGPGERSFEDFAMAQPPAATLWAVRQAVTLEHGLFDQYVMHNRVVRPTILGLVSLLMLALPALAAAARRGPLRILDSANPEQRRRWLLLLLVAFISYGWFFAAKFTMMELYEPSRYLIFAGLVVPVFLFADLADRGWPRRWLIAPIAILLLSRPFLDTLSSGAEKIKPMRAAIDACARIMQPGEFVAGEPQEMDEIAMAAHAGVFECFEMAQPYYTRYWKEYQRRLGEGLRALISSDPADLSRLRGEGVRYLLVDRESYREWLAGSEPVYRYEPLRGQMAAQLARQGGRPAAWEDVLPRLAAFDDGRFALLDLSGLSPAP